MLDKLATRPEGEVFVPVVNFGLHISSFHTAPQGQLRPENLASGWFRGSIVPAGRHNTPYIARESGTPPSWLTRQDHAGSFDVKADKMTCAGASGRFATQNVAHEADVWPHE